jgi:hypothetical protein
MRTVDNSKDSETSPSHHTTASHFAESSFLRGSVERLQSSRRGWGDCHSSTPVESALLACKLPRSASGEANGFSIHLGGFKSLTRYCGCSGAFAIYSSWCRCPAMIVEANVYSLSQSSHFAPVRKLAKRRS